MLPEGWRTVSIGSVVLHSQYGLNLAVDPNGNTPIIGMKDMVAGRVRNSGWGSVSIEGNNRTRYLLRHGDILLNRTNSPDLVGKVALWDRTEEAVFPSYIVRFKLDEKQACPAYINLVLNTVDGQSRLRQISTRGVSQANINPTTFQIAYVVTLPPLPEQRRIAAVLDAWDSAISIAERLIKAKYARFDWLRDQVLTGRQRLHGFNDVWRTVRLADVVHEHGLRATGDEQVFSVSVHKGLVNQIEHLGRSFSASDISNYNRVLPGDIVYTKSPTGEFPLGIIKQSKVEKQVIVSPLYGVFTPHSLDLGIFLDAYFTSPKATEKYLTPLVQKGAKNTIAVTNTQFLQGVVPIPGDDQEIEALARLVASAIAEIAAAEEELERFRQQKRGLMQQLLTGKLRVPESVSALRPPAPELVDAE